MKVEPKRLDNIPAEAQWLSGIGAGSWFAIQQEKESYRITRYSAEGIIECSRLFTTQQKEFDIDSSYAFTFLSHCKECTIIQNKITYKFITDEY